MILTMLVGGGCTTSVDDGEYNRVVEKALIPTTVKIELDDINTGLVVEICVIEELILGCIVGREGLIV